jgi:hypothetical protein
MAVKTGEEGLKIKIYDAPKEAIPEGGLTDAR